MAGTDQAVTVMLAEYDRLKSEQQSRIAHRDNLVYASLAATATIIAATATARITLLLLLLPVACTVLGWNYLTNDHMVSAIGRYLRDEAAPRLADLTGHTGPMLGWEHDHRGDRRRRSRKVLQLATDLITFTLPPLIALAVVVLAAPLSVPVAAACLAEFAMLSVLAVQIIRYADLRRHRR